MNWKPKKGIGKTLYAVDIFESVFKGYNPNVIWSTDTYCPLITKYTGVMIITNGTTKDSTYIVAKKKKDSIVGTIDKNAEYRTYILNKIDTINEDKQGVVVMRGKNIIITNDKKELLNIFNGLYKKKEIIARKAIEEYKKGLYNYIGNSNCIEQSLLEQPKHVMTSYKYFVKKLKKI